jgi:hypothetical protein
MGGTSSIIRAAPVLLVAALLSILLLRSGLDAYVTIVAAAAAVAYVVMTAGHLLLGAAGKHGRDPSAGFVVGLLAICLAVYALTVVFPITAAFAFGAVAALVIGMRIIFRRRLDAAVPAVAAADWRKLAGLALCVAFTYAWCAAPSSAYETLRTQGVLPVWADYFFHGGLISQFGDPRALGHGSIFFAGQSPTFYHFGSYGVAAALAGMLEQPGLPIATSAWLPLGFLAMLAGAYALGERLADSAGGVAALVAVAIIPDASNYGLRNGFFSFQWTISATVGATYALGAAFVSLAFLDRWATERSRAALAASALLALASLIFRVQIFLLYFPAWIAAAAICGAREGEQRRVIARVMLLGLAAGAVVCFLTVDHLLASDPGFWRFQGGALEGFLRSVHTDQEPTAYTGLYAYLQSANAPAITLMAGIMLAIVAALGVFVILFPAACLLAHEKRVLKPIDALCGLLSYCWLLLMLFAPVLFNGDSTDLIHRPFVLLYAAMAIWTVCLVLRVATLRLDRVRAWQALLLAAILALPAIASDAPGMMHPKFRWGERFVSMPIPPGLVEAASIMRKHATAGDIFAVAGMSAAYAAIDVPLQVCALSGMPAYLSRPFLEMSKDGPRARVAAARLAELHAVDDAADYGAAMQRLRAIDVRWYLVTDNRAPRWDPARKRAAFVARSVALYDVRDTSR